jgi:hypothetical protein
MTDADQGRVIDIIQGLQRSRVRRPLLTAANAE